MKRCPTCQKTFTDRNLSFCVVDGTPLVPVDIPDEETIVSPSSARNEPDVPAYQPPRAYVPPGAVPGQSKRRVWPWVVGILALVLLIFIGLGIAAAVFIPRMVREIANSNTSNSNTNRRVYGNDNFNTNSNSGVDDTDDNLDSDEAAPTDHAQVLSDLSDLEHEWTVANINADKKKLERILADDYVATYADGSTQGKADYLKTITRDTTMQDWSFDDLELELVGDRASLKGKFRSKVNDETAEYRFTDKFVWRDGRWQATSSVVTPIK